MIPELCWRESEHDENLEIPITHQYTVGSRHNMVQYNIQRSSDDSHNYPW